MRLFYYVKSTLKGLAANGVVTIAYFVLFPVLLAGFMGFMQSSIHENPLKLKNVKVKIINEDNSEMSKRLVSLLESKDMKELIKITDDKEEAELVIHSGYEESVISCKKSNLDINIKEEGKEQTINTIKVILDKYHQSLYVALSGGNQEGLDRISGNETIKNIKIDTKESLSSYETISASMIGFVITMLIYSLINNNYADKSMNLDKRVKATPVTRRRFLYYDSISLVIYCSIIIASYVLFFRLTGISFRGETLDLGILVLSSAILVTTLSKCVNSFFGPKYGKLVGLVLFMLPIIGMEMFTGEGNALASFAPTHYISKLFNLYNLNGNLSGVGQDIIMIFGVSVILFVITIIKESLTKGGRRCA